MFQQMRTLVVFCLIGLALGLAGCGGGGGIAEQAAAASVMTTGVNGPTDAWAGPGPVEEVFPGRGTLVHMDGWLPRAGQVARYEWRPEGAPTDGTVGMKAVFVTVGGADANRRPPYQAMVVDPGYGLHLEVHVPADSAGLCLAVTVTGIGGSTMPIQP